MGGSPDLKKNQSRMLSLKLIHREIEMNTAVSCISIYGGFEKYQREGRISERRRQA